MQWVWVPIPQGARVRFPEKHIWAYGSIPPGTEGIVKHSPAVPSDWLYDVKIDDGRIIVCYAIEIEVVKE